MRPDRASRTAEHNALFRALETTGRRSDRLFSDPIACNLLSFPLSAVARLASRAPARSLILRYIDRRWPGVRTSVVARTRLIDDELGAASDGAAKQLVVLGAGYDTRAHRLDALGATTVFEVDHPATQQEKRRRLARSGVQPSSRVHYVPCDFSCDDLERVLTAAGFRKDQPSIILWEGVTSYLTADAVDATLRWCAGTAAGSRLVFTYIDVAVLTNPAAFEGSAHLFRTLSNVGEQLTFGLDPATLAEHLAERGIRLEKNLSAPEYRRRYYGVEAERMRGHEFYQVAFGTVSGGPWGSA